MQKVVKMVKFAMFGLRGAKLKCLIFKLKFWHFTNMVKVVPSVGAHNLILDQPDDRLCSSELNYSAYDQTSSALFS